MKHEHRYIFLDYIRGISALLVCAGHLRGVMFEDYSLVGSTSILDKLFYFLTGLGHQAVMIFFVLSGFFVGGSIVTKIQNFHLSDYLLSRLTRLWVVLIPALLFTTLVDVIIKHYYPAVLNGQFYSVLNSGPQLEESYSLTIQTFFSNVFFLQDLYAPVYGSNGPLWSLAYEFWFYILFPLGLIAFGFIAAKWKSRLFVIIVCASILIILGEKLWLGFTIWMLGVFSSIIINKQYVLPLRIPLLLLSILLLMFTLIDSKFNMLSGAFGIPNDLLVGISFMLVILTVHSSHPQQKPRKINLNMSRWLSELSYTLYLVHFPVVLLIFSHFYSSHQLVPDIGSFFLFCSWLLVIVCISLFLWWCFERNTAVVRHWIRNRIDRKFATKSGNN
ncbi:MAG: acyltransferase [Gammaproteobacteria bacterium]|nr:acyltransferase [Gammaproteobacteria bacterium]MDH5732117.1 acyltransferase [Gammaproteobacteria bacterium]